jgi:hypothetical protein
MTELTSSTNDDRSADSKPRSSPPRIGMLLGLAVGLSLVGAGGVYWWTFAGGEQWAQELWMPAKAAFRGKVTLDGEPLRGGQLTAWPDRAGVPKSLGFIEQNGEFLLRIDVGGKFLEEAFVGRYRVSVTQFEKQQGPSPPKMTTPAKYSSPDTSGLVIVVDRDPAKNIVELNLLSDAPPSSATSHADVP